MTDEPWMPSRWRMDEVLYSQLCGSCDLTADREPLRRLIREAVQKAVERAKLEAKIEVLSCGPFSNQELRRLQMEYKNLITEKEPK